MKDAIDPTVFYVACYLALVAASVVAWRWGLRRSKGQVITLWIGVALILPFRFVAFLVPEIQAIQPIHILMFVSAVAGTLGQRPSRVRIFTLIVVLWGASVPFDSIIFKNSPEPLWQT